MDAEDLQALKEAIKLVVDPLKETVDNLSAKVDKLPCGEHSTSIVTLETQRDEGEKHKKQEREKTSLLIKVILVIAAIGGLLQSYGFLSNLKP